jgi:metal-responsive CopG/Arc/MetJ family transcriptional regulator
VRQGRREKVSVTIDPSLYDAIDRHARRTRVSKSKVIEDAIRLWQRSQVAMLAREGYQATAGEDLADAEAYLAALDEIEGP